MRTRSLIVTMAGAVLVMGAAIPAHAAAAAPSPSPVPATRVPAQTAPKASDVDPNLLRRCLTVAAKGQALPTDCAPVTAEVGRIVRPAAPGQPVKARPSFTG